MKRKPALGFLIACNLLALFIFSLTSCGKESALPAPSEKTYNLRDTGPAGGIIFYDKGSYSDGWRYLEAAPQITQWSSKQWGKHGTNIGATETSIGKGKDNTDLIVSKLNQVPVESGMAAQLCKSLNYNGYSDWFLPSIFELNQMYVNLKLYGVGNFENSYYWSSTEDTSNLAWTRYFGSDIQTKLEKNDSIWVRAIRAF